MLVFRAAELGRQSIRFYSTAAAPVKRPPVDRMTRVVKTLDPTKFREEEQERISLWKEGSRAPRIYVRRGAPSQQTISRASLNYLTHLKGAFPADASGYFYFRPAEPHRPAASAEIRFRLATSPETFATGKDLEKPDGEPWGEPLFALSNSRPGRPFYDKLVEDRLVTQDVNQSLVNLFSSSNFRPFIKSYRCGSIILFKLSDPFTIDLSAAWLTLLALTENTFGQSEWLYPFREARLNANTRLVYKGAVRLRFEPSSLPQHTGTRMVVVRVLEEIQPIESVDPDYDGWVRKPQVGELVMTPGIHGAAPLSFDLDASHPMTAPTKRLTDLLRLLWENDPLLAHVSGDSVKSSLPPSDVKIPASGTTRMIKTLDPAKFRATGQTSIDISGEPTLRIAGPNVRRRGKMFYYNGSTSPAFPSKTTGYLYFQPAEADRPRICGELRFRLSSTADDFAAAEDLKRPDGTVWQVPLFALIGRSYHRSLLEKIVEEGLVPPELADTVLMKFEGKPEFPSPTGKTVLCKLPDPFTCDLSQPLQALWAVTDDGYVSCRWASGLVKLSGGKYFSSYHGVVRARFEMSTLPEHAGTRTVVVRVLDILTPITQDPSYQGPIPVPREGELLVGRMGWKTGLVSYDLDASSDEIVPVLRRLWDSDVKLGTLPSLHPPSKCAG